MGISRYPYPATNNSGNVACSLVSSPDPPPSHEEVTGGGEGGGEGERVSLTASTSSQIWRRMLSNWGRDYAWLVSACVFYLLLRKPFARSPSDEGLVPRPHLLMRRSGLANCTFATVSPSNVQNILHQTHSKRYGPRQIPPSHEEKWSGEPSWISGASAHFCDSGT